jgi:hypothetical protein
LDRRVGTGDILIGVCDIFGLGFVAFGLVVLQVVVERDSGLGSVQKFFEGGLGVFQFNFQIF